MLKINKNSFIYTIGYIFAIILIVVICFILFGFIVQFLWNNSISPIFNIRDMKFSEALYFTIMCRLLVYNNFECKSK